LFQPIKNWVSQNLDFNKINKTDLK
jgi:hypothetical protein